MSASGNSIFKRRFGAGEDLWPANLEVKWIGIQDSAPTKMLIYVAASGAVGLVSDAVTQTRLMRRGRLAVRQQLFD